jgi:hypothetical protein
LGTTNIGGILLTLISRSMEPALTIARGTNMKILMIP